MTNGSGVMITANWEVLLKIHFQTDQATWTKLDFKPTSSGKLEEP
jgi:hypothetical protein